MKKILIVILAAMLALSVAFAASADGWKELYDQKEYEAAYPAIKEAAEAGDTDAIAHLAAYYTNGIVVEKDLEKAAEYYRQALEAGYEVVEPAEQKHVKELLGEEAVTAP